MDRFGDADRPLDFLLAELPDAYEKFNQLLDSALRLYLAKGASVLADQTALLSAEEKIEWLLELVAACSPRASYRARFEEDLAECLLMDRERRRVLRGYLRATEEPWLWPLCELADGLRGIAIRLEESLICENCGYRESLVFHSK